MAYGEGYDEFVEKFKPKLTTDDCYTPKPVYDKLLEMVVKRYGLQSKRIVRPFYPGGDYERSEYLANDVVLDNPPFSLIKKIVLFYQKKGIPFFLFAPRLTCFSLINNTGACVILGNLQLTYQNGADISTAFVTNLEDPALAITSWIELEQELKKVDTELASANKKKLTSYQFPIELLTSSMLTYLVDDISFKHAELYFTRALDNQRQLKKSIYGSGFLIPKHKAQELRSKQVKPVKQVIELSAREQAIVDKLDKIK